MGHYWSVGDKMEKLWTRKIPPTGSRFYSMQRTYLSYHKLQNNLQPKYINKTSRTASKYDYHPDIRAYK